MNEADARVIELEAQRNFFATRCVRFAEQVAGLQAQIVAKDAAIGEMRKAAEAKPAGQEPDPQP